MLSNTNMISVTLPVSLNLCMLKRQLRFINFGVIHVLLWNAVIFNYFDFKTQPWLCPDCSLVQQKATAAQFCFVGCTCHHGAMGCCVLGSTLCSLKAWWSSHMHKFPATFHFSAGFPLGSYSSVGCGSKVLISSMFNYR